MALFVIILKIIQLHLVIAMMDALYPVNLVVRYFTCAWQTCPVYSGTLAIKRGKKSGNTLQFIPNILYPSPEYSVLQIFGIIYSLLTTMDILSAGSSYRGGLIKLSSTLYKFLTYDFTCADILNNLIT